MNNSPEEPIVEVERENAAAIANRERYEENLKDYRDETEFQAHTQFALEKELKDIQLYAGPGQLATIITSTVIDPVYLKDLIEQMTNNLNGR